MTNDFELLKDKDILAILDGDTSWGIQEGIKIAMPYLSGSDLCSLSTRFGLPKEYTWRGGNPSRWYYLQEIISYCIDNNTIQKLLSYMFDKARFQQHLKNAHVDEIDYYYNYICKTVLAEINKLFYFSNKELIKANNSFYIKGIGQEIILDTPDLKVIDRDYI